MIKHHRYFRYFFIERKSRTTFFIILLLIGIQILFMRSVPNKRKELISTEKEIQLVMLIPQMEQAIREKTIPVIVEPVKKPTIEEIEYNLKGTMISEGSPMVIISGVQYKLGDIIGDYLILDITLTSVTLQNNKTYDIKTLNFAK